MQTTPLGLSTVEAERRLLVDGPNRLVPRRRESVLRELLRLASDPMVVLLLVAAPTYLAIGHTSDGIVTLVALGPIAAVGWILERRAERTLEQLSRLTAPTARVRRDDAETEIPAECLVVGDVITIREGDVVPADAVLVETTQLHVDESALTGESLPITKSAMDDLSAGTTVLSGRAVAEVSATGPRTRYGTIARLVAEVEAPKTPLQREVSRMVRAFGIIAVVFCIAVMITEVVRGNGWAAALIAGVSLAIAAVPEEFPMVYTLYLALGAWRLTRDHALVRHLPGVETLGSTTTICTDKTGTLTHGRLAVGGVATADGVSEARLLEAAVLACEPDPFDPLDVAIVGCATSSGLPVDELLGSDLVVDHPFDPRDKYLVHEWRVRGARRVAAKGSIEGILRHCRISAEERDRAHAENARLAEVGMRVIAVAEGSTLDTLEYCGLVGFDDPIRDGVAEALAECRTAGIRVVMITGDHPVTAHAVAEGLRLPHTSTTGEEAIATGDDLDALDDAGLADLARSANVFARTRPEQKHRLVRALRADGEVVAMTGDGINDAPALREADIGVAMGERGTTVAREAATMVLLDDNFATIVKAVRDGRRIFDNLRRAFSYLVAFHIPLLGAALVVPFAGRPLLLLPVHLVLLELVLHPAVSLVFEADPADPDIMSRPPRGTGEGLLNRTLVRPLALGLTLAGAVIGTYLVADHRGWSVDRARGAAFAVLLIGQLVLLLVERSPRRPIWRGRAPTRTLWWVLSTFVATIVAVEYLPAVADLLELEPPSPGAWPIVIALGAASTLWAELFKLRRGISGRPAGND